jgi:hypothetical protein
VQQALHVAAALIFQMIVQLNAQLQMTKPSPPLAAAAAAPHPCPTPPLLLALLKQHAASPNALHC